MSTISILTSNDINVFPSTRRSDVQPSARYQTEATFTNQIRHICNYKKSSDTSNSAGSFIITEPLMDKEKNKLYFNENQLFEFCIYGYYFCIRSLNSIYTNGTASFDTALDIYAYIELDSFQSTQNPIEINKRVELIGHDETAATSDTFYSGLKFTDDQTIAAQGQYLHLFHRDTTLDAWNYSIYLDSIKRIASNTIQLDIDGGIIE